MNKALAIATVAAVLTLSGCSLLPMSEYTRPPRTVVDTISDAILMFGATGVAVFFLVYVTLFRWWKTESGKAVLYFTGSLFLVLALVAAARLTGGDYFGREWMRLAVYSACAAASWGLVITQARAWFRGDKPLDLHERETARRRAGSPTSKERS